MLAKMSFDEILDLTGDVFFLFYCNTECPAAEAAKQRCDS